MTRVDLDRLEAWAGHEDHSDLTCQDSDRMLLRLIPELRAARPIVEAARQHECGATYQDGVWALIVAYDEVVTS